MKSTDLISPAARDAWVQRTARDIARMTEAERTAAAESAWHEETTDAIFTLAAAQDMRDLDAAQGDMRLFAIAVEMVGSARGEAHWIALADQIIADLDAAD